MGLFIKKLISGGKIKLNEPSDEVSASYMQKADKSLLSAKTLLNISHFDDATALVYYSMYYCVLSLFHKCGIKSENHTGTIFLLKEIFGIDNSQLKDAKKERIDKQYYVEFKATKEEVIDGFKIAEEFNSKINDKIDRMSGEEKRKFREKMKEKYF